MTQRLINGVNGLRVGGLEPNNLHTNGDNGEGSSNGYVNGNDDKSDIRKNMDRKKSSPMMPTFMVSAPGKVIVCGEHAVVHGKVSRTYLHRRIEPSPMLLAICKNLAGHA